VNAAKNVFDKAARAARGLFNLLRKIASGGLKNVLWPCGAGFEAKLSAQNMMARVKFQMLLLGKRQTHEFKITFNNPAQTVLDNWKTIKNLVFAIFKAGGKKRNDRCDFKFFPSTPPKKPKSLVHNLPKPSAVKKKQSVQVENPPKTKWNKSGKPERRRKVKRDVLRAERRVAKKTDRKDKKCFVKHVKQDMGGSTRRLSLKRVLKKARRRGKCKRGKMRLKMFCTSNSGFFYDEH